MRVYATRDDLVDGMPSGIGLPDEPEAFRLLARASEAVELLTLTAVYPVDAGGMPTKAEHIEAFKTATCAQAVHWLDTGDETGTAGQWSNVTIGSITLGRAKDVADSPDQLRTSDSVIRPLRLAGLLPGSLVHRPYWPIPFYPW